MLVVLVVVVVAAVAAVVVVDDDGNNVKGNVSVICFTCVYKFTSLILI